MTKDKIEKGIGLVVLGMVVVFLMLAVLNVGSASTTKKVTIDSPVAVAKDEFYGAASKLCEVKREEYKNMILNDSEDVKASDAGVQIDRLKTEEGCYSFASEVLLHTAQPEESGK
jgi:Na+-transporting methylmalonyl-CoA/oxaloacetate decarboxylase gamma subunit